MEVRKQKGKIQKRVAVLLSAAFFIGSVWQPINQMQPIYAAEKETEAEIRGLSEPEQMTASNLQGEAEREKEQISETEITEETEASSENELPSEPEQMTETELPEEPEQESETELPEEPEQESKTEFPKETEQELATEEPEEMEQESVTEKPEETEQEIATEAQEQTPETELPNETEQETETVQPEEMERMTETISKDQSGMPSSSSSGFASYWDESWYIKKDFRFVQVPKEYALVEGATTVAIYEQPDAVSEVVGEIPYFGIVYILKEVNELWVYVESGDVRGFLQANYLTDTAYTENLIDTIGEEGFQVARSNCEKADNTAFTFTQTTVQEVLVEKQYSMVLQSGYILEYPQEDARKIGKVSSGALVYLLEETEDGWVYVESGESRGFLEKEMLLSGSAATEMVQVIGESEAKLAETYILPDENRSCYFSLKSVKAAASEKGEQIAAYAASFAGKLPYIWGGTSLESGADCSGFVQSVYAAYGIQLPRLAQEQGISGIEIQSIEAAQPGDVVYWADGPHVGIYLGNGKVAECSGNSSNTTVNPGKGVTITSVDYRPITSIRRFQIETEENISSTGNRADETVYTQEQIELIWAIVAQEDNGSYAGALAVISSAMNRTESARWNYCGSNALTQLTAPGQYCYTMDQYWKVRLNGNVPDYVKQAVYDCLKKGIRNHSFTCFRSQKGSQTGVDAVQIGGNWFFGN